MNYNSFVVTAVLVELAVMLQLFLLMSCTIQWYIHTPTPGNKSRTINMFASYGIEIC